MKHFMYKPRVTCDKINFVTGNARFIKTNVQRLSKYE